MLTINALTAANEVIIPVQSHFLPAKGLEQLLGAVAKVKRQINPALKINGILLTMVDGRTNLARDISQLIRNTHGSHIKVFKTEIPLSIKAAETSAVGKSIYSYDKNGRVADAMGFLKWKSSLMIFDRHANLKYKYGTRHFWCRGYYVDTVGKNKKIISEYI